MEVLFDQAYGITVSLDYLYSSVVDDYISVSIDSSDLEQNEKDFLNAIIDEADNYNWDPSTAVSDWQNYMDQLVCDALDSLFTNENIVLATISIAKYSAELWYDSPIQFHGGNSAESRAPTNPKCFYRALVDDIQFYADWCDGSPNPFDPCLAATAVYSVGSYDGCADE
jgi:hypothetical protein